MGQFGTHTKFEENATGWLFTFHMPLFAILSGLFFNVPEDKNVLDLLKKKTIGLLVPNATWCFLFYIAMHGTYMLLQTAMGKADIYQGNLLWDWWYAMCYEGWWFLRALLIVYLYAILSVWFVRNIIGIHKNVMLMAGAGSCALLYTLTLSGIIPNHPQPLIGAIYLYPFVWAGVAVKSLDGFLGRNLKTIMVCSFALWIIGLYFWKSSYTFYGMNTSMVTNGDGIAGIDVLWATLFRFVIGVIASLFFISLLRFLFSRYKHGDNKLLYRLADVGKYTLFIYVAPSFFFHAVKERIVFSDELLSFTFCTLCSLVIVVVCYWGGKIADRWKWSRLMLLGINRK